MTSKLHPALSRLPKVDRVLAAPELAPVVARLGVRALTLVTREVLAEARERSLESGAPPPDPGLIVEEVRVRALERGQSPLQVVINATGVLLHTNLGRAPLPRESLLRIAEVAGRYSSLELDVELGVRTRRGVGVEARLAALVGAEDALLVNNNAAAVLLALSGLCAGRDVLVSRGELLEIGGGFRIPDVLARSGARLVEVGTTNRTRADDYARAMDERTAGVLRVHPSNFKMTGFTERPSLADLAALARARGVWLLKDLGGGLVVPLPDSVDARDQAREPSVQACLTGGADVVCFSLDKLFGGPQAGALVGQGVLVQRLREDPLARALRVDKVTLAALEPLLDVYERGELSAIPLHRMLAATPAELLARAERCLAQLGAAAPAVAITPSVAAIGGGTLADATVASLALTIVTSAPNALAKRLRRGAPAVVGRVEADQVVLDLRTVLEDEDALLVQALRGALVTAT
ncbi:MAG: L-seryl-tRNA(Sec) selenium transferase [Polyangiaceae bacterium]|nr:L-seryl-tRNA(Sec) selenium transferase [Polyangiaceae bacterium]